MQIKKIAINIIKILVVIAAYFFIIFKIIKSPDLEYIPHFFSKWNLFDLILFLITITLMLLNWSIETIKWQNILPSKMRVGFIKSFKAVLAGITVGTITPNRIGEFGGRILMLKNEHRKKAAAYTIIADFSQFITTICFGVIAFSIIGHKVISDLVGTTNYSVLILIIGICLAILSLLIYFNISFAKRILFKFKKLSKYKAAISEITDIKKQLLLKTLLLSAIRFIIFIIQFYLILNIFDINISPANTLLAVSNIYFATTIIPNIPFGEIGIRSSFSIIFLGLFSDSITAIVIASLLIYIINIAVPALFGGVFLLKLNNNNHGK